MKRICASAKDAIFYSLCAIFFLFLSLSGLMHDIVCIAEKEPFGAGFVGFAAFGAVAAFLGWCANRFGCLIRIENGVIKRRGLFVGFYKDCSIENIQNVIVKTFIKQGDFFVLIDDSQHPFDYVRKDSCICFRKTKRNTAFLKTFWNKEVIERTNEHGTV